MAAGDGNSPKGLLNEIQQITECALCLDTLDHPRSLPCQHVFCESCLNQHITSCISIATNNSSNHKNKRLCFSCPNCRKKIPIPKQKAKAFPYAFHHKNLIDAINKHGSVESSSSISNDAEEDEADAKSSVEDGNGDEDTKNAPEADDVDKDTKMGTSGLAGIDSDNLTSILLIANDIAKWMRESEIAWQVKTTKISEKMLQFCLRPFCYSFSFACTRADNIVLNVGDLFVLYNMARGIDQKHLVLESVIDDMPEKARNPERPVNHRILLQQPPMLSNLLGNSSCEICSGNCSWQYRMFETMLGLPGYIFYQASRVNRWLSWNEDSSSLEQNKYNNCIIIPNQKHQLLLFFTITGSLYLKSIFVPAILSKVDAGPIRDHCVYENTMFIIYKRSPQVLRINFSQTQPEMHSFLTPNTDKFSAYKRPKSCIAAHADRVAIGVLDPDDATSCHRLHVVTDKGIPVFTYGRSQGNPLHPSAVAISQTKLVFVADYKQRSVLILSPEGTFIGKINIDSWQDIPMYPCALAFDSDNNLLVASKSKAIAKRNFIYDFVDVSVTQYKIHMFA